LAFTLKFGIPTLKVLSFGPSPKEWCPNRPIKKPRLDIVSVSNKNYRYSIQRGFKLRNWLSLMRVQREALNRYVVMLLSHLSIFSQEALLAALRFL